MSLCECGCGTPTNPAKQTWTRRGVVKGQPQRFVRGHQTRGRKFGPCPEDKKAKLRAANAGHPPHPSAYRHFIESPRRGAASPSWKGGVVVLANRYLGVRMPEHPRAYSNGYVYEHILVAEEKLRRPLAPGEVVHHLDHNSLNNDPSNLVVVASHSEHIRLYHRPTRRVKAAA
jgi:hypothetical protein